MERSHWLYETKLVKADTCEAPVYYSIFYINRYDNIHKNSILLEETNSERLYTKMIRVDYLMKSFIKQHDDYGLCSF